MVSSDIEAEAEPIPEQSHEKLSDFEPAEEPVKDKLPPVSQCASGTHSGRQPGLDADSFVDESYSLIWSNPEPGKTYAWDTNPYYEDFLDCLKSYKWGMSERNWCEEDLRILPKGKQCSFVDGYGKQCKTKADCPAHFTRHLNGHLPIQIGFHWRCPTCGSGFRRGDMMGRHANKCSKRLGSTLKKDSMKNVFLR